MDESQAIRTYYWVLFNISVARIMKFSAYKSACGKLNAKIIEPALANYHKQGIMEEISTEEKAAKTSRWVFSKIVDIRKLNAENIGLREYIISQIRTCQK